MACEFLGSEFKRSKQGVTHQRDFCTLNDSGCLVADPLGYVNCTRRTFALLQTETPAPPAPKKRPRRGPDISQVTLL